MSVNYGALHQLVTELPFVELDQANRNQDICKILQIL
jgi:hypothetical protein